MSDQNTNKEYEFVTETIKKKPVNKKRLVLKIVHSIGFGVIAGLTACAVFGFFGPKLYTRINPDEPDMITIPEDEQEFYYSENETVIEGEYQQVAGEAGEVVKEEKPKEEEINTTEKDVNEADATKADLVTDNKKDENTDVTVAETDTESQSTEKSDGVSTLPEKDKLTLSDYKTFYKELSELANVANRSLVKVTGVTSATDWFNNSYDSDNVTSGLIVADNGKELLIITNAEKLESSKEIEVTFCDSRSYKGTVKKADSNTGLVVVAVLLEDIQDATRNSYAAATLGNSTVPTLVGTPVMALGSPLGIENSMAVGVVTSNTRDIQQTDSNIRYITTDIYGSTEGSGVIIDLEGNVLGIIFQGGTSNDTKNLIHAYSISDIKSKIEKLSNGQDTAYLGIVGTDVTKRAMEELNVPEGAYVKQVVVDSPAMNSGIQNGDIIVKLGTTTIRSFRDYKVAMSKCQPGDTAMVTVKRLGKDGYAELSYEIYLEALK